MRALFRLLLAGDAVGEHGMTSDDARDPMKVAILAGGFGSRLAEETTIRPKPLVEIGGIPILWHIMKIFDHYGVKDFVVALGYKGEMIKEYMENYSRAHSHIIVDFRARETSYNDYQSLDWR